MDYNLHCIGKTGERIAEKFLKKRGYSILHKNFTTPFGEIDIVARENRCIVFVEVKTRITERYGPPLASIRDKKKQYILRNCQYYLKRFHLYGQTCRIDAFGIKLDIEGNIEVIKHIKNAIEMEELY